MKIYILSPKKFQKGKWEVLQEIKVKYLYGIATGKMVQKAVLCKRKIS